MKKYLLLLLIDCSALVNGSEGNQSNSNSEEQELVSDYRQKIRAFLICQNKINSGNENPDALNYFEAEKERSFDTLFSFLKERKNTDMAMEFILKIADEEVDKLFASVSDNSWWGTCWGIGCSCCWSVCSSK